MTDEPLIWTSLGNLPESRLAATQGWEVTDTATVFWQEWRLGDELVKRAVHVLSKAGVTGECIANPL